MQMKSDPTIQCINKFFIGDISSDIDEICRPLKKWDINSFFYSSFHEMNRINLLSNNSNWLNYLKSNLSSYRLRFENQFHYRPGFSIDYLSYFSVSQMTQDMIQQGMKNAIYLTNVSKDRKFSEVFIFTISDTHDNSTLRLATNVDNLNIFCFEFKDKAQQLIKQTRLNESDLNQCDKNNFPRYGFDNKEPNFKHYYFGAPNDDLYLTHKEFLYLKAYMNGESCKTIAKNFNMSYRSIETRLQIIKNKIGCKNKSEILDKIICSQLYYLFFAR